MTAVRSITSAIAFTLLSIFASQAFAQPWSFENDDRFFQNFEYRSSAWEQNFGGNHFRSWSGINQSEPWMVDWLYLELDQTDGGWDTTIARLDFPPTEKKIGATSGTRSVGYKYDFRNLKTTGSGAWWCGAKVVYFKQSQWPLNPGNNPLEGSYECYVVENSDLTANQLKNRFGLTHRGDYSVWGRTYKQYTTTLNNGILQVWAIRSNIPLSKKSNGMHYSPVGLIKTHWRSKNYVLPNFYPLGWMAFIETQVDDNVSGSVHGTGSSNHIGGFESLWLPPND